MEGAGDGFREKGRAVSLREEKEPYHFAVSYRRGCMVTLLVPVRGPLMHVSDITDILVIICYRWEMAGAFSGLACNDAKRQYDPRKRRNIKEAWDFGIILHDRTRKKG